MTGRRAPARLDSLTSLRIFAALPVVLYHCGKYLPGFEPARRVTQYGFVGVTFFFVLSGFVLTWSHLPGDRPAFFYWRRFARIWPLLALTTVLAVPVMHAEGVHPTLSDAAAVLLLVQAWRVKTIGAYNGVTWSLSCEAFFYAVFPAVVAPLSRLSRPARRAAVVVLALLLVVPAVVLTARHTAHADWLLNVTLYTHPLPRVPEFLLGVLLALAVRDGWRPPISTGAAATAVAASYGVLCAASWVAGAAAGAALANVLLLPGFVALIAAAAADDLTAGVGSRRPVLHGRLLVRLGQWSFAVYLLNELLIRLARAQLGTHRLAFGNAVGLAVTLTAATVALSGLAFVVFERPVEARLRRLIPAPARAGHDDVATSVVA